MLEAIIDEHRRLNSRGDANPEGSCLLKTQVFGNQHLDVSLGYNVVLESSILMFNFVSSVAETTYTVALLEFLCDFAPYLFDNTGIIAADLDRILN